VRFGPKGQQVHGLADTVQYTNIKYEAVLKKEIKNKKKLNFTKKIKKNMGWYILKEGRYNIFF